MGGDTGRDTDLDTDLGALRRLLDIEEITQLKARYFRTMDRKDWPAWAEVFATDAVMEVPEAEVVLHGRDAIAETIAGMLAQATTVHHGHMPEIELTGPDTARGIWAMFDYVEWVPGAGFGSGQGYGHYHDDYTREDGQWRIARTKLIRLRVDKR
jgi:uncharacterized protein (TIGR02246 family)